MNKPVALIVGVGAATGQSVCRKLAEDYRLAMIARSESLIGALARELPDAHAYVCDVSDRAAWEKTLIQVRDEVGLPVRILVNTESGSWGSYAELPLENFSASFDVNVVSLLQLVQTLYPLEDHIPAGDADHECKFGLGDGELHTPALAGRQSRASSQTCQTLPQEQLPRLRCGVRNAVDSGHETLCVKPGKMRGEAGALAADLVCFNGGYQQSAHLTPCYGGVGHGFVEQH